MDQTLPQTVRPRIGLKRVLIPTEHGAWSFLIEPLLVGCIIAASFAAPWIMLMTIGAFFARQPLKVYLVSRRNSDMARRTLLFFFLFITAAAVGLMGTVLYSGAQVLFPMIIAGPLAVRQLYADASGKSRSLAAELFGAIAISSSIAMMMAAGGFSWAAATAIWLIFASRFVASILYVRNRLLLEKGKPHNIIWPLSAHLAGLIAAGCLAFLGFASWLTFVVFALLLARSTTGLSRFRTKMKAMTIGVWEVVYGILTVVSIIAGHYLRI